MLCQDMCWWPCRISSRLWFCSICRILILTCSVAITAWECSHSFHGWWRLLLGYLSVLCRILGLSELTHDVSWAWIFLLGTILYSFDALVSELINMICFHLSDLLLLTQLIFQNRNLLLRLHFLYLVILLLCRQILKLDFELFLLQFHVFFEIHHFFLEIEFQICYELLLIFQ